MSRCVEVCRLRSSRVATRPEAAVGRVSGIWNVARLRGQLRACTNNCRAADSYG